MEKAGEGYREGRTVVGRLRLHQINMKNGTCDKGKNTDRLFFRWTVQLFGTYTEHICFLSDD